MSKPSAGLLNDGGLKNNSPIASWFFWLLRLGFGAALIVIIARWQGADLKAALQNTSWPTLFIAVACYLATQGISAWKWKLLLSAALRQSRPEGSTPFRA